MVQKHPAQDDDVVESVPTREGYDRWSDFYDVDGNPLIALEEPVVAEWLGRVTGLSVIDVGCGTGRHAVRLAREGASVTALDFSHGMLRKARTKSGAERVAFVVHDLAAAIPVRSASFDRAICCLVVEHIADPDHLFAELRRVCKPDGLAIVTAMHPAMFLRGVNARFIDPATGGRVALQSYAHQVSDFVMAAVRAGFEIDRMVERAVDDDLGRRLERASRYVGWPMLLAMSMRPRS